MLALPILCYQFIFKETLNDAVYSFQLVYAMGELHRRIQDFVRGGGARPSWPPGGGGKALLAPGGGKALLAPLDPRLTIWGSNFLWGGGAKAPLPV